jgi:hypothetical protein
VNVPSLPVSAKYGVGTESTDMYKSDECLGGDCDECTDEGCECACHESD